MRFLALFLIGLGYVLTAQSQNVGIGTTAPTSRLDIWGVSSLYSDEVFSARNDVGDQLLNIRGSGHVGIGSATPGALFEVLAKSNLYGDYASAVLDMYYNSLFSVQANGTVAIGDPMGEPTTRLYVKATNPGEGVIMTGEIDGTAIPDFNFNDHTLMYYPCKGIFRVGNAPNNEWHSDSSGIFSTGIGHATRSLGEHSVALGRGLIAQAYNEIVLGSYNVRSFAATSAWRP
ncbi:MAG: hypothetical protein NZ108_06885, partial [Bacteroidia bacterium]|nr:hypothetical protein [Bacteroidia bacterium]